MRSSNVIDTTVLDMTKIKDILSIHLEEDIQSVIDLNVQTEDAIIDELNGFILTESLAKHLQDFCDFFISSTMQPGLWLSGFYGSGKSYFAKMVGYLLKNPVIKGTSIRERFMDKLIGLSNEGLLRSSINELGRTENHVVLFDAAKAIGNYGISYMMMSAFLKSINLNDDWIGIVEFNLLLSGSYQQFCDKVQERYGESWTNCRKNMDKVYDTLEETMLDGFCSESAYEDMRDAAKQRIMDYDANRLQEDLDRYLKTYPDRRIVFMVDEVSEAIAQNKINILDLEGTAEAVAVLGRKVWMVAIAQLQLDDVINETNVNKSLLTKIIDRFRKRINITAEEVDTIIRRRLLAKNELGDKLLKEYYVKNSGKISDITNIVGTGLKKTTDAQTYSDYSPFYEHQFKMLQYFLFGTQKLVKTQVGTRGMLISAFDVLKKEAISDRDIHSHVNAAQLCRQAEEAPSESLRARYTQADEHIRDLNLKYVTGRELLQTIHFLTEAAAKTTVENISRAYVNCPDDYFTVLEEAKKACGRLAEDEILVLSGDEYRITSETQQRIFEMMAKYDEIPSYRIKGEISKRVKLMPIVRHSQSVVIDTMNISFSIVSDLGESYSTGGDPWMKIVFHDIMSVKPSFEEYVETVREETQSAKNMVSIVPSIAYITEIQKIAEQILRVEYITQVPNLTTEEKKVVDEISSSLEDKMRQLEQYVSKSYNEGTLVYLYNTSILTSDTAQQIIRDASVKMYGNIYTKRLSSALKDSLASQILRANQNQIQNVIGQAPDFLFFDTAGTFIGEDLPVVREIKEKTASYKCGADLEKELGVAPTGYGFGTIFSTLAVLFRANRVIVKYENKEYHSYNDEGAKNIFISARNFQRASFKFVTKTLSYNEKREIVETLKDCRYKELTGNNLSYNLNDFELVDAIRQLSLVEISKVNNRICENDLLEKLFHRSVVAKVVLHQYTSTVTEFNYFTIAKTFLNDNDNDDFCNAIEKIEEDIKFIQTNFETIRHQRLFMEEVKNELEFVGIPMQEFDTLLEQYELMLESAPVQNFSKMVQTCQKVKDWYFSYMQKYAERMKNGYEALTKRLLGIKAETEKYPREWNEVLVSRIDGMITSVKKYLVDNVKLDNFSIRCSNCHLQLRDMDSAVKLLSSRDTEADVISTTIRTVAPAFVTSDTPSVGTSDGDSHSGSAKSEKSVAPTAAPFERKLRNQLPKGNLSVAEYRSWLMQQLSMVNNFGSTDILKFDE